MSERPDAGLLVEAIGDFRRARFQARIEQVLARLRGQPTELLEYEEVRRTLRATNQVSRGLQDIPIEAIVGSVGRTDDFTRSFLPRQDDDEGRWARVKVAMTDMAGLPPIEVYQIDQAYFVLDGNHRVSVARQLGATHIQAYVTEIETSVPLSPDVQPDDLIIKAEYAAFLARTRIDQVRPEADLSVGVPGQYQKLEEHIAAHQYFMGLDERRGIPYPEAVAHWYDTVYLPVVAVIRDRGLLRDFGGAARSALTETDLYLWILEHRAELGKEIHWEIPPEEAAQDLAERYSSRPGRVVARAGDRLTQAVVPRAFVAGPPAGEWRQGASRRGDRLFADVLVAVTGTQEGWCAVDSALHVTKREGGRLLGLHVVEDEEESTSLRARNLEQEFLDRCKSAEIPARWVTEVGGVSDQICAWGRWCNLAVVSLAHPPGNQPLARLESGFRALVQRCPVPILAVPPLTCEPGSMPGDAAADPGMVGSALLAYDGSPKADEALYVCTYLAGQWGIPLVVVTVSEQGLTTSATLARAWNYLREHGVHATYVERQGDVGDALLDVAQQYKSDLFVMGGYGFSPVVEIVLGSAVDQVLRVSRCPVLICR
jgi:nucleotide-binding universal stress UspA family protein